MGPIAMRYGLPSLVESLDNRRTTENRELRSAGKDGGVKASCRRRWQGRERLVEVMYLLHLHVYNLAFAGGVGVERS
jgi:hypothetical protein